MKFYSIFPIIALLVLCSCGGSGSSSVDNSTASVSISPSTVTVVVSTTTQFTAKVSNATTSDVTWYVNGVNGGDATNGTISGTGLYTAPSAVPSTAAVTVTAISVANNTKTADATVTIANPITVSPDTVSVQAGSTQQFTATVNFSTNKGVLWEVNGVVGGNSTVGTVTTSGSYTAPNAVPSANPVSVTAVSKANRSEIASATTTITPPDLVISPTVVTMAAAAQQTFTATVLSTAVHPTWTVSCKSSGCGSIDANGVFTAPITPPRGGYVTITASMQDGSALTETSTATIQFANATLAGQYTIAMAADSGATAPSQVGTLVFDGAGHITGGTIDSTDAPGVPVTVTSGTYQVSTDGRGSAAIQGFSTAINLKFALSDNTYGYVVRTDSSRDETGTIELQQNISPLDQGNYVLSFVGQSANAPTAQLAAVGAISIDSSGGVAGGAFDSTSDAVLQTQNVTGGTFSNPSSGGRGALTVVTASGTRSFAYYPVNHSRGKLIAIDGESNSIGDLELEATIPFTTSSLNGQYAFLISGTQSNTPFAMVGKCTFTGAGSIADIQFDGLTQTVFDFNAGAYAVTDTTTGRTTATWTANSGSKLQYVFYPRSDGSLVFLETDGMYSASGIAKPRTEMTLTNFLALQGAFALQLAGSDTSKGAPISITGAVVPYTPTIGSSLSGTIDGVNVGQNITFAMNLGGLNGTAQRYVFGIASTNLGSGPDILYRIDDNEFFMIVSDGTRVLTGDLRRQY